LPFACIKGENTDVPYPRSKDYFRHFERYQKGEIRHGWMRVDGVAQATLGDLVVYENTHSEIPGTGHVMFVYSDLLVTGEPFNDSVGITVFDSAVKPHGDRQDVAQILGKHKIRDSRSNTPGQNQGVGVGRMWFGNNNDYYCWSSPFGRRHHQKIIVARPLFTQQPESCCS